MHRSSGKLLIILACASRKAMDRWKLDIGRWGPDVAIRGVSRYCCQNCPTDLLSEWQYCPRAVFTVWRYCPSCVLCLLPSGRELGILGNGTFLSYGLPRISAGRLAPKHRSAQPHCNASPRAILGSHEVQGWSDGAVGHHRRR